jgi:hypothetical protein
MKLLRIAAPVMVFAMAVGTGAAEAIAQSGPPTARWDAPPSGYHELQRRGFHDGIVAARRDIRAHHRPDVNNRPEFRNPPVPANVRQDYRESFRQGYNLGIQHALGGGDNRL